MTAAWHPRGVPTWPGWRDAPPGTRVAHVRSGRTGTFTRVGGRGPHATAVIAWDPRPPMFGGRPIVGRVVAPAFDLRPIAADPPDHTPAHTDGPQTGR